MEEFKQLRLWEEYEPQVNDYVIWEKVGDANYDEGWVYFKSEEYITIETGVRPRSDAECEGSLHQHIHTLLVCNSEYWCQLKYVKSRTSQSPHHYSECED